MKNILNKKTENFSIKKIDFTQAIKNNLTPQEISQDIVNSLEKEIIIFLGEFLPRYSDPLKDFFTSYIKNVSSIANSIEEELTNILLLEKPDALVFSAGASNLVDRKSCLISNNLNIPVIFMRHQGIEINFFPQSFLDTFVESDLIIKRKQFLLNDYETKLYPKHENVSYEKKGWIDFSKPLPPIKAKKGIIYSAGPPDHFTFKNPRAIITNMERFNLSKNLLHLTQKHDVSMDIKVHPCEWEIGYDFFHQLIKDLPRRNKPRILLDGSIERIIRNYELVVIDIISTRVLTFALYYDLQIILYIPEEYYLNLETFKDLEDRIHIVRTSHQLNVAIEKFCKGTLLKKNDNIFKHKYLRNLSHDEFLEEAFQALVN